MAFVIGLLTFLLVLTCALLVLLILIQLPKKEAGVGVAFGGAATDALFGAGSGNVLTKATKYAATCFFLLAVTLSVLQSHFYHRSTSTFRQALQQAGESAPPAATATEPSAPAPVTPAPATPAPAPAATTTGLNLLIPPAPATNAPTSAPPQ
jgi:preprotein translocase subunit SecG